MLGFGRRMRLSNRYKSWLAAYAFLAVVARAGIAAEVTPVPPQQNEPGIPVTNQLVVQKCGGCHKQDDKGNMTRISWIRTTPEGWEEVIKRMVRLNGVSLTPAEAKEILNYLATDHGLAPEEAKPVMWFAEHRIVDENVPEPAKEVCNACHAFGKAASWRRSKEEWELLYKMHIGYFPSSEMTSFRREPPPPGAPPPAPGSDQREPFEKALSYLQETYPLHTPEWAAFSPTMQRGKVTGRWLIAAYKPGEGPYYGEMTVEATSDPDIVATRTKLISATSGSVMTRTGKAAIYQGYAWRGRSEDKEAPKDPQGAAIVREVMILSRDQSQAEGRWMWGDYQEFGFEVRMFRARPGIMALGVDTPMLRSGEAHTVQIFGEGFSSSLKPADIDLGEGVTVQRVSQVSPTRLGIEVAIAKTAKPGRRNISIDGTLLPSAVVVYDHIDFIKVSPDTGLSRLGSEHHPKGYVQFEAIAYLNGPDGKANTPDDVELGPVRAKWAIQEFYSIFSDDDVKYVGSLNSETGLFTPNRDGPNPERRFSRNNYGDVWVEAEVDKDLPPPKVAGDKQKPLTARSYLIVTVPLYLRYDQPEVAP
jgi:quinohemoprotein amine dehydrogenase